MICSGVEAACEFALTLLRVEHVLMWFLLLEVAQSVRAFPT